MTYAPKPPVLAPFHDVASSSALLANLMRYAKSRLRNVAQAEDAVSETLLAALESGRSISTIAQQTAWTYGVLRHKLVDQLRHQGREMPSGDLVADGGMADAGGDHPLGAWPCTSPADAGPEWACSQRQLVERVVLGCDDLSPLHRKAFVMRELQNMDPLLICQALAVTEGHLWVLLHRARMRLRQALSDLAPGAHRLPNSRGRVNSRGGAASGRRRGRPTEAASRADVPWVDEREPKDPLQQERRHHQQSRASITCAMRSHDCQEAGEYYVPLSARPAGGGFGGVVNQLTEHVLELDTDVAVLPSAAGGVVENVGP
jgi:RNA polymerase sigma factor (sigma-70 family)